MTYGIPDSAGIQLDELKATVAAVEPTKSHAALRQALAQRWPTYVWRVAAPEDEFSSSADRSVVGKRQCLSLKFDHHASIL